MTEKVSKDVSASMNVLRAQRNLESPVNIKHVFGWWEEAKVPRENSNKPSLSMQQP